MKQIIQSYKNGKISLEDVPEPAVKAGGILVRTVASLISPGTEKMMIEMGRKSLMGKARARPDLVRQAWAKAWKEGFFSVYKEAMNRLDEPIPLGYSAAGEVIAAGAGVLDDLLLRAAKGGVAEDLLQHLLRRGGGCRTPTPPRRSRR